MKPIQIIKLAALVAVAVVFFLWRRASERVDAELGEGTWAKSKLRWKLETIWRG